MDLKDNPNFPDINYLRERAKQRIPGFAFEYLDHGCNSEVNLRRNTEAIRDVLLKPVYLRKCGESSLETELFGMTYSAPFGISPIGLQGLIWPRATEILASAAREANIPFILSTVGTASIEKVAELTEGRAWFQLYHPVEDRIRDDLLRRASEAGMPVLVVLADVPSFGYRSREIKNGLAIPPRMTLRNLAQITTCPRWALGTLLAGQPEFQTLKPYMPGGMNLRHLGLFMNRTFSGVLDEDKLKALRDRWPGKLVLKGVASEEDAAKAVELGFDGLMVSNHGGRQLDSGESALASLRRVSSVCGDRTTVMMDSGIRTGPDIANTLASGADFAFLGRSFMYGVGALGKSGGTHTISILTKQLRQVLQQLRCERVGELRERLSTPTGPLKNG